MDTSPDRALLPYEPGTLPTKPAPRQGESISFEADGYPPVKTRHASFRNPANKSYRRFVDLRHVAATVMAGRAWYFGPVRLDFELFAPTFEEGCRLVDYMGGIMDTLCGGHGPNFTYLPIVYQDDGQVSGGCSSLEEAERPSYKITITFL